MKRREENKKKEKTTTRMLSIPNAIFFIIDIKMNDGLIIFMFSFPSSLVCAPFEARALTRLTHRKAERSEES